jgi:hypothetical protein
MPFPTAPILDTFVRADEGPPPSANWSGIGVGGLKVVSNQCVGDIAGQNIAYWNASAANPIDYEIAGEFPTVDAAGLSLLVLNPATFNGHYIFCSPSVPLLRIEVITGGVPGGVVCTTGQLVSSGDSFGMRRQGSNFGLWYKSGAGAYTEIATGSEGSHLTGSPVYMANLVNAAATAMIDFRGGAYVAPSSYRRLLLGVGY